MEQEKLKQNKVKKTSKKTNSVKSYIRDFLLFADKNLIKKTRVLLLIAIVVIAVCIGFVISITLASECEGTCRDGLTFGNEYWSNLKVLALTLVSGIVPYIYVPVIGFLAFVLQEISNLAYAIKGYGYLVGIGVGIVPLILNVLAAAIITALGMYICRNITIGYRITNLKNMNIANFKIKLYEILGKEEKVKELTKNRDKKIEVLQGKKEKINLLQILSVVIVVCIIQFISVLIQQILL